MMQTFIETAWHFQTRNFTCALEIHESDIFPDWCEGDELRELLDSIESGETAYFDARMVIWDRHGREIASDWLGSCHYQSHKEFVSAHRDSDPMNRNCEPMRAQSGDNVMICHYFPDMVRQACRQAREALGELCAIPLRTSHDRPAAS